MRPHQRIKVLLSILLISFQSVADIVPCDRISNLQETYQQSCEFVQRTHHCHDIKQKLASRGASTEEFRNCTNTKEQDFQNSFKNCSTPILMGLSSLSSHLLFKFLNVAWGVDALVSTAKMTLDGDEKCFKDIQSKKLLIEFFNKKTDNIAKLSNSEMIAKLKFSNPRLDQISCSELNSQLEAKRKSLLREVSLLKANKSLSSQQIELINQEFNSKKPANNETYDLGIPDECLSIEKKAEIACEYLAASMGFIDITKTLGHGLKQKYLIAKESSELQKNEFRFLQKESNSFEMVKNNPHLNEHSFTSSAQLDRIEQDVKSVYDKMKAANQIPPEKKVELYSKKIEKKGLNQLASYDRSTDSINFSGLNAKCFMTCTEKNFSACKPFYLKGLKAAKGIQSCNDIKNLDDIKPAALEQTEKEIKSGFATDLENYYKNSHTWNEIPVTDLTPGEKFAFYRMSKDTTMIDDKLLSDFISKKLKMCENRTASCYTAENGFSASPITQLDSVSGQTQTFTVSHENNKFSFTVCLRPECPTIKVTKSDGATQEVKTEVNSVTRLFPVCGDNVVGISNIEAALKNKPVPPKFKITPCPK